MLELHGPPLVEGHPVTPQVSKWTEGEERIFGFWTPRRRFWKSVHHVVNGFAWRYGMEPGWRHGMFGSALHVDNDHWLWRLNNNVADRWSRDWLTWRVGRKP